MIELRWLERDELLNLEGINIEGRIITRRIAILQYRVKIDEGTMKNIPDATFIHWSEWIDVPTVKESEDGMDKR